MRKEKVIKCIMCDSEWLALDKIKEDKKFICPICKRKIITAVEEIKDKKIKKLLTKFKNKIL